jgi:uncharacterized protein
MWYERDLGPKLASLARVFPALIVTGARQTGKTSLLARLFPERRFVSLDLPSLAEEAEHRPAEFLARFPPPVTIDEVQYAPGLFRHLKSAIDADRAAHGQFLLSGSQKFHLMRSVSESLAGRCGLVELRSLSAKEYAHESAFTPRDRLAFLLRGGFPELCANPALPAAEFFRAYTAAYLERDVRNLLRVGSLRDFERFVRMAAGRSAGLLNMAELARDVGIAPSTAGQWISVLEASGVVVLLEPYFENFGKRIVKTPKLFFADTGLLCFLLGLDSVEALLASPLVGHVWETFVLGQILRQIERAPTAATVWFWRDAHGAEVDFLIDAGGRFTAVECKWTEHPRGRDLAAMEKVLPLLRAARPVTARIACRTPHAFGLAEDVEAVNGFTTVDWIAAP